MARAIPLHTRIVTQTTAEVVSEAFGLLPPRIFELIGETPVFEGRREFAGYWSSCPEHWCSCYHKRDGRSWLSCVSLPTGFERIYRPPVGVVLHELGHALTNRLFRRHARKRVYWSASDERVLVRRNTGLLPAVRPFVSLKAWEGTAFDPYQEQFAEAFRIWLSPPQALGAQWEPGRFYRPPGALSDHGIRADNRALLALFNELAGWPFDTPPRAIRCPS